jgi:hypothetical protein
MDNPPEFVLGCATLRCAALRCAPLRSAALRSASGLQVQMQVQVQAQAQGQAQVQVQVCAQVPRAGARGQGGLQAQASNRRQAAEAATG